jgi:hypothetical protein
MPAAAPAEPPEPAVEVISVPDEEPDTRGRSRARRSRGRGRRLVHLLPLGLIVLLLLGVLGHDLLLPDEVDPETGGVRDPNPYIAVRFDDGPKDDLDPDIRFGTMRFGLVMLREKDPADSKRLKRLTWDEWGRSNSTCVRVDRTDFQFGQDPGAWLEQKKPLTAGGEGLASSWALRPLGVKVTQEVQVVRGEQSGLLDTCLVRYVLENKDTVEHRVGIRFLLDTFIGANDGVPFTIPGAPGLCDTSTTFNSPRAVPDFIQALEYDDLRNPGTVANVQFRLGGRLESPSRVILGGWPARDLRQFGPRYQEAYSQETLWDVPVISMRELQRLAPRIGRRAPADSAVTMYWPEKPLAPGGHREVGFAYGLGKVSSGESQGKLLLTVGGQLVRNRDFTLTALVNNPQPGEKLTLELPSGFTLVDGQREQAVPRVPAGAARSASPVTWHIRAGHDGSNKLTVLSSTGVKQTLPIRIRTQGVFD